MSQRAERLLSLAHTRAHAHTHTHTHTHTVPLSLSARLAMSQALNLAVALDGGERIVSVQVRAETQSERE